MALLDQDTIMEELEEYDLPPISRLDNNTHCFKVPGRLRTNSDEDKQLAPKQVHIRTLTPRRFTMGSKKQKKRKKQSSTSNSLHPIEEFRYDTTQINQVGSEGSDSEDKACSDTDSAECAAKIA